MRHTSVTGALRILLVILGSISILWPQKKPLTFHAMVGPFNPTSSYIKGMAITGYDQVGSPTSLHVDGYGYGPDFSVQIRYGWRPDWTISVEGGATILNSRKYDMSLAPTGDRRVVENQLVIIPMTLSMLHYIAPRDHRVRPYFGLGVGLYKSAWSTQTDYHSGEILDRIAYDGGGLGFGFHFAWGFDTPISNAIRLGAEFRYSIVNGNWTLRNTETGNELEYQGLNLGGASIRIGLGIGR